MYSYYKITRMMTKKYLTSCLSLIYIYFNDLQISANIPLNQVNKVFVVQLFSFISISYFLLHKNCTIIYIIQIKLYFENQYLKKV